VVGFYSVVFILWEDCNMSRTTKLALVSLLGVACAGCSWSAVLAGIGAAGGFFEIAQLIANFLGTPILPGV
jgi:hypothetical protein